MLRVNSPTDFHVIFPVNKEVWIRIYRIIVGANWIRPPMIQMYFPILGLILPRRDAMLCVFSRTGFHVIFPVNKEFWIRIYRILRIIVGANCILPPMIQMYFPFVGTMLPYSHAMLRVISPTGFHVIFTVNKEVWIRIYRISRINVGANWIRPPMIQIYFPLVGTMLPCRNAMPRVISPTGFHVIFPVNKEVWIKIYRILRIIAVSNWIRPPMIQMYFLIVGTILAYSHAMPRVISPTGFHIIFPVNKEVWIRIYRIIVGSNWIRPPMIQMFICGGCITTFSMLNKKMNMINDKLFLFLN
jgi:hypothetical protein